MITYPYVESFYTSGNQKPSIIILTPSWTSSKSGAALGLANHWNSIFSPYGSGHFVVDEEMTYQTAALKKIAGARRDSIKGAIRITICAEPIHPVAFWHLDAHAKVLGNAADLVCALSSAYGIRSRYLDDKAFVKWRRFKTRRRGGIRIESPGVFPSEEFMHELKERT